jgi:hypothetical protein
VGPAMCKNPDAPAPDPTAYCRSEPGVEVDPVCWQRNDSGEVDVLDNWQGDNGAASGDETS